MYIADLIGFVEGHRPDARLQTLDRLSDYDAKVLLDLYRAFQVEVKRLNGKLSTLIETQDGKLSSDEALQRIGVILAQARRDQVKRTFLSSGSAA